MKRFALAAAALSALAVRGRAQIAFRPGGSLRIEGDSSLHKWGSTATVVSMTFQPADGAPKTLAEAITASKITSLEVRIPVAGLRSGESGLDKNMRKAMRAQEFPDIVYRLERYELTKGASEGVMAAKIEGRLTIAEQTKPVTIDVEFRAGPNGPVVKGSYRLKMSDYGITPPTLMLGAIKTRDPVTIRFDLLLTPQQE